MSNNKLTGIAGEYLACFDASMNGYSCSLTTEESEYDMVLDTGKILLKVQVKSSTYTRSKTGESLSFTVCRRNSSITEYNVDLFAFVDVENKTVAWIRANKVNKYRISLKREEFSKLNINSALNIKISQSTKLRNVSKNLNIRSNTYYSDISITTEGKGQRIRKSLGVDYNIALQRLEKLINEYK